MLDLRLVSKFNYFIYKDINLKFHALHLYEIT